MWPEIDHSLLFKASIFSSVKWEYYYFHTHLTGTFELPTDYHIEQLTKG
jgi:hypothetical protein